MTARRAASAVLLLLAVGSPAALAGCSPAKAKGDDVAAAAVEKQICGLVKDGALSPAEITSLGRVLDRAHSLGLPNAMLDPAHEIVSTGFATDDEIGKIRSSCTSAA